MAHDNEDTQSRSDEGPGLDPRPIQYCPWCGEHVGSFWGKRDADGDHWCEACQTFFHVEER